MANTAIIFLALALTAAFVASAPATETSRTCYTCEGVACQRTSRNATVSCSDPLDYCVTIFEQMRVVRKGCSLEVPSELRDRCEGNARSCHKCYADRCNDLGAPGYRCLQCDSKQDANCKSNPLAVTATRCSAPTATVGYCYVRHDASSGSTERGCATTAAMQVNCLLSSSCGLCLSSVVGDCNSYDL